jgi:hypothetical protein
MSAAWAGEGFLLNNTHISVAPAAVKPRERDEAVRRPNDKSWKPYPCLLTREELQQLIAEQLG